MTDSLDWIEPDCLPLPEYCRNCWKLDRTRDWCERHGVKLERGGGGFVKCGECAKERQYERQNF